MARGAVASRLVWALVVLAVLAACIVLLPRLNRELRLRRCLEALLAGHASSDEAKELAQMGRYAVPALIDHIDCLKPAPTRRMIEALESLKERGELKREDGASLLGHLGAVLPLGPSGSGRDEPLEVQLLLLDVIRGLDPVDQAPMALRVRWLLLGPKEGSRPRTREDLAESLSQLGPDAAPEAEVRREALDAISALGSLSLLPELQAALHDPDEWARSTAVRGLCGLPRDTAPPSWPPSSMIAPPRNPTRSRATCGTSRTGRASGPRSGRARARKRRR